MDSTDLSVVKARLAHRLHHVLALCAPPCIGDLRELGSAVADILRAYEIESSDPDTRSSIVIGVLVKYGHYYPTNEEIELLVKITEA